MPSWVPELVIFVVGLPALAVLAIVVVSYLGALGLSEASLEPADPGEIHTHMVGTRAEHEWAEANGYEWVGAYRLRAFANPRAVILAWQSPGTGAFFCVYLIAGQRFYDLVTGFDRDVTLTTGSSPGAMLYPMRPGSYLQAFTGLQPAGLYERHLEGEACLMDRLGVQHAALDERFDEHFARVVRAAMMYVRSIPLWPLRVPWWYATKWLRTNKPVERQYPELMG